MNALPVFPGGVFVYVKQLGMKHGKKWGCLSKNRSALYEMSGATNASWAGGSASAGNRTLQRSFPYCLQYVALHPAPPRAFMLRLLKV